ncbi:unnamed protein product [Clavelina lepadiformis]|uniref:Uncharacterized protein n=1 Tax=Clavelina lepadiformis TaxID=159417 RepID=A0ABP0GU14_CLALP
MSSRFYVFVRFLVQQENPTTSQGTLRQAHWDSLVQRHMDLTSASTGETIWARDVLFKFYQAMENIQENLKERQDILNLLNLALLQIHDR